MYQLLYKYLVLNKEVSIPGIGSFVLDKEPARLDMENKVVHAPLTVIKLKPYSSVTNNNFYEFLGRELNTDVSVAIKRFQNFSLKLKEEVEAKKWVELPGMGTLTPGVRDEIKFKSAPVLKDYYPSIAIEKISRIEVEEPVVSPVAEPSVVVEEQEDVILEERKPRDLWWVWALILALSGAAAIFYYYYYLQPVQ